jgi:hypothetical protein
MLAPIFHLILMFAGFIGVCWITNAVFSTFRKKDEEGRFDRIGALVLWTSLFGAYSYFIANVVVVR